MSNLVIVVSGASGGLGSVTSLALLKTGHTVIGIDIADSKFSDPNYHFYRCDLTNKEERIDLINKLHQEYKHIDVIINLAGIFMMESIVEGSEEHLRKIIEVNFFSMYHLNKGLIDLLDSNSKIINMSSEMAIYSPQPFMGYYVISKRMVDTYTDVLRREANYIGIKVIKIQSGAMKTKMLSKANDEYDQMVATTCYFASPLAKMKYMMDREITKNASPEIISNLICKIIKAKNPKIRYRVKNSKALRLVNALPEKTQDNIYKKVIK